MTHKSCHTEGCAEVGIASLDNRDLCYRHFLDYAYRRLEEIAAQIHDPAYLDRFAQDAGSFLEDCIRDAANVACLVPPPGNLERARVLDVLLWASELHGMLRRGPRVPASITVHLSWEDAGNPCEERTETQLLSHHGAQIVCRHDVKAGTILTCVRPDTGERIQARVVWRRRRGSGETELGIEFLSDANFWNLGTSGATPQLTPPTAAR